MKKPPRWWDGVLPPLYYSFAQDTQEFVDDGGPCDPSPLEPDVWLVPGYATLVAPPPTGEKQVAVWAGDAWVVRPDHRGEVRYIDGEFVAITSIGDPLHELGLPDMVVHDAEWWMPPGAVDESEAKIHMWINDDEIDFFDDPNSIPRRVLAAWEAKGETIRPLNYDVEDYAIEAEPEMFTPDETAARHLDALAADLDKLAQRGVEGIPVPQEEL